MTGGLGGTEGKKWTGIAHLPRAGTVGDPEACATPGLPHRPVSWLWTVPLLTALNIQVKLLV